MDYEYAEYQPSELVKMDIMIHGEVVDAFSSIVRRSKAESRGRQMCKSLLDVIPRQAFTVALQAAEWKDYCARDDSSLPKGCDSKMLRRIFQRKLDLSVSGR